MPTTSNKARIGEIRVSVMGYRRLLLTLFIVTILPACSNQSDSELNFDKTSKELLFRDVSGNGYYHASKDSDGSTSIIAVGKSKLSINGSNLPPCGYKFYGNKEGSDIKLYIYDLEASNLMASLKERVSLVLVASELPVNEFTYDLSGLISNAMSASELVVHPDDSNLGLRYTIKHLVKGDQPSLEILLSYLDDDSGEDWELDIDIE